MKNIFFLSGLPRSGNTLLSAILNQNPEVFVSPSSPLLDNLTVIDSMLKTNEPTKVVDYEVQTTTALQEFTKGFYKDIDKPVIIDRNKGWGDKRSMYLAYKYVTDKPKVIYMVRDVTEILASFIKLVGNDENTFMDRGIAEWQIHPYGEQTINDLRCEWLMRNQVGACLVTLTELLNLNIPVCLIEYNDLVINPEQEINKVYEFLELPKYKHDFNNITKLENEDLLNANLPANLHNVLTKIKDTGTNPNSLLSNLTLQKYAGLEFWRNK